MIEIAKQVKTWWAAYLLEKLPFSLELFINGSFLSLYFFKKAGHIPPSWPPGLVDGLLEWFVWAIPLVIFFVLISYYITSSSAESFVRRYTFSILIFIPLAITWGDIDFSCCFGAAHLLGSVWQRYYSGHQEAQRERNSIAVMRESLFDRLQLKPIQLVMLAFLGLILLGALLLAMPFATRDGQWMGVLNALFTATSAICVTGLATLNLSENFSFFWANRRVGADSDWWAGDHGHFFLVHHSSGQVCRAAGSGGGAGSVGDF